MTAESAPSGRRASLPCSMRRMIPCLSMANVARSATGKKRLSTPYSLATFFSVSLRRSEEHTSELQSLAYLVCRLLLEKKNKRRKGSTLDPHRCHRRRSSQLKKDGHES